MKTIARIFCFALFGSSLLSLLHAAETSFPNAEKAPSRLYFGGEITHLDISTNSVYKKITGKNYFKGLRLGYDIIKPNSPYFGFHALLMRSKATFQFNSNHALGDYFESRTYTKRSFFANPEFRIGQTFAGQEALSTLFLGMGSYFFTFPYGNYRWEKSVTHLELLGYLTGGALISYAFSPSLHVGCHLKAFWVFYSRETLSSDLGENSYYNGCLSQETRSHTDKSWGYQFGIPLTWQSIKLPSFDTQFEPYYLKINTKRGVISSYGVRLTFGSRF
ncbi:MAG: hypothetical protein AAF443_01115 [Chlamydiota bacterium]